MLLTSVFLNWNKNELNGLEIFCQALYNCEGAAWSAQPGPEPLPLSPHEASASLLSLLSEVETSSCFVCLRLVHNRVKR